MIREDLIERIPILIGLAMALILINISFIPFISAAEYDNTIGRISITKGESITLGETKVIPYKEIWEKYAPIKIENVWGLPIIGYTLAEGAITSHTETCGSNCKSEFTLATYVDDVLIKDIRFKEKKFDGKWVDTSFSNYKIYIQTGTNQKSVPIYKQVCIPTGRTLENGTVEQTCSLDLIRNDIVDEPIWSLYNLGDEVKAGIYNVKIEAEKNPKATIDWQINVDGIWIEDWALWGVGAIQPFKNAEIYYNFSSNTNMINPATYSLQAYGTPLLVSNTTTFQLGDGKSLWLVSANKYIYKNGTMPNQATNFTKFGNYTMNGWALRIAGSENIIAGKGGSTKGWDLVYSDTSIIFRNGTNAITSTKYPGTGKWVMITVTSNTSGGCLYINGTLDNCITTQPIAKSNVDNFTIGGSDAQDEYWGGYLDEWGFWNISLNDTDITQLYNSGTGLMYASTSDGNITINSPVNYYNSTGNNATFNCSAESIYGLTNISYLDNSTGTLSIIQTNIVTGNYATTVFYRNFSVAGKYNWTCQACADDGTCTSAQQRTINITYGSNPSFGKCGSNPALTIPVVNYSFRDSTTLAPLTAYIVSSFNYSSEYNLTNATITYNSGLEYDNITFCSSHHQNYTVYPYIQYASVGYPLATYNPGQVTYNNITTETVLDLTSSATGIYVTIQIIDITLNSLSGVSVEVTNSTGGLLGSLSSDSSGSVTFFLEPTRLTTFTFNKTGYVSYQMSIYPTQTLYTVTLSQGTGGTNISDYSKGITKSFLPSNIYLNNNTAYNFNFTINSTFWTLQQFGINVTSNGTNLGSLSSTVSAGTVNVNINTKNNQTFIVYGYWIINGSLTQVSQTYYIWTTYDDDWSISRFFTDLRTYLGTGLFGLQMGFGMNIIIFLIILIITGVFSWKYGLYSPLQIAVIVAVLVTIFDAVLGLVTNINGSSLPLATIVSWLVVIGIMIKEVFT